MSSVFLGGAHGGSISDDEVLVLAHTGTGRDKVSDDDVLLHADQGVAFGVDGGLGEDLGGLLEGCGGDEGFGLQRGASDALENLTAGGGVRVACGDEVLVLTAQGGVLVAQLTCGDNLTDGEVFAVASVLDDLHAEDLVVDVVEVKLVDQVAFEEAGVARVEDFDFAHHLTDDDLEVFVVDFHTLQTVDFLNLVDNVFLHLHRALDGEDVGRGDGAVGERRASLDIVAVLSQNLFGGGDEVGALFAGLGGDGNLTVAAFELLGDGDDTVDFGHDGGVGRVACFEEFGDAGQTARDVAGLAEGARDFHHDGADGSR